MENKIWFSKESSNKEEIRLDDIDSIKNMVETNFGSYFVVVTKNLQNHTFKFGPLYCHTAKARDEYAELVSIFDNYKNDGCISIIEDSNELTENSVWFSNESVNKEKIKLSDIDCIKSTVENSCFSTFVVITKDCKEHEFAYDNVNCHISKAYAERGELLNIWNNYKRYIAIVAKEISAEQVWFSALSDNKMQIKLSNICVVTVVNCVPGDSCISFNIETKDKKIIKYSFPQEDAFLSLDVASKERDKLIKLLNCYVRENIETIVERTKQLNWFSDDAVSKVTIRIEDIDVISPLSNSGYFTVRLKNGAVFTFNYNETETKTFIEVTKEKQIELLKLYNDINKIPDMYYVKNSCHAEINGQIVLSFGYELKNVYDELIFVTSKKYDKFVKQFKIIHGDDYRESGESTRSLTIAKGVVTFPAKMPKTYLEQLTDMGYDIAYLTYEKE